MNVRGQDLSLGDRPVGSACFRGPWPAWLIALVREDVSELDHTSSKCRFDCSTSGHAACWWHFIGKKNRCRFVDLCDPPHSSDAPRRLG
jgi:hypothetical protein